MDFKTIALKEEIEQFLSTAYLLLGRDYLLFTIAMFITCIVFPIFIVRLLSKREGERAIKTGKKPKVYLFRTTAKMGLHYAVLTLILVFAVQNVYSSIQISKNIRVFNKSIIFISSLLMLFALYAVFFLFRFYARGLLLSIIFVMLYSLYKQYLWGLRVWAVIRESENYNMIARYGSYVAVQNLAIQSMIMSVVMTISVMLIVLYYYKRRYLFTPGRLNLPFCERCGKAICRGDNFCINCGIELKINPVFQPIDLLDEGKFCRKCGKSIKYIGCRTCMGKEWFKEVAKSKVKEKVVSVIWGTLITAFLFLCVYLPPSLNPVERLQKGTAHVNNNLVIRWNEFCETPNCVADSKWLDRFDSDIEALYLADMRWYYVDPRIVPYRELVYYTTYAEASFMQMEALEQMREFVHNVSAEERISEGSFNDKTKELEERLNQTIITQSSAVGYLIKENKIYSLMHSICNGLSYYIYRFDINFLVMSILIIIINVCMLVYILNDFSLTTETAPERWSHVNSVRTNKRTEKLYTMPQVIDSDCILHRTAVALRGCIYSVIRVLNEIWHMVVWILCTFCLFLSLFRFINMRRCLSWMKVKLSEPKNIQRTNFKYKTFWRRERISIIIAVVIVFVYLALNIIAINGKYVSAEEQYVKNASWAANDYAKDIVPILHRIYNTRTLTDEERENLYSLIEAQIEIDQIILNYDMEGIEGYAEFHAGLCSLCKDDIKAIQEIRETIENNIVPSQELMIYYVGLRAQKYEWVLDELVQMGWKESVESAYGF